MFKRLLIIICTLAGSSLVQAQTIYSQDTLRYLALGDSYTIGESVSEAARWPNQLVDSLRKKGVFAYNADIIARTGWRTDQLRSAITQRTVLDTFNLVSILIGVNNQYQGVPVEGFPNELKVLINHAIRFAGGDTSRVFVVSIPDYAYTPFGRGNEDISEGIAEYNAVNKQITDEYSIDYYNITPISERGLDEPELVANDGLHPSGKQYTEWVNLILQRMQVTNGTIASTQVSEDGIHYQLIDKENFVLLGLDEDYKVEVYDSLGRITEKHFGEFIRINKSENITLARIKNSKGETLKVLRIPPK